MIRDITRFFWLEDPDLPLIEPNLKETRFQRWPFGMISSPFILNATMRYHCNEHAPRLAPLLEHSFYVDNFLTSVPTIQEAKQLYTQLNILFDTVSIPLKQWGSSHVELRNTFTEDQKLPKSTIKLLGILWDQDTDTLFLNPKVKLHYLDKTQFC